MLVGWGVGRGVGFGVAVGCGVGVAVVDVGAAARVIVGTEVRTVTGVAFDGSDKGVLVCVGRTVVGVGVGAFFVGRAVPEEDAVVDD